MKIVRCFMDNNSLYIETKSYLMELISRELRYLSGKIKTAFGDYNKFAVAITEVNDIFYGRSFSEVKTLINEYKEHFPKKQYADYNFFDLDTLNNYFEYLRDLNYTIDSLARHNNRQLTRSVYSNALVKNATKYSTKINQREIKSPKLELDENGRLTPSRLKGKWDQGKVWSYQEYIRTRKDPAKKEKSLEESQMTINFYGLREDREPIIKREQPTDTSKQELKVKMYSDSKEKEEQTINLPPRPSSDQAKKLEFEVEQKKPTVLHKYKGRMIKLEIESEDTYFDMEGRPVSCIKASGHEGLLFTTLDMNGNVYTGDLYTYDEDDNLVYYSGDTGETFYPEKEIQHEKQKKEKTPKNFDPNQLSMDEQEK